MTHPSLVALGLTFGLTAFCGLNALAQTNERLLQERLISPAVYELLNSRGADTREKRMEVMQEACATRQLPPSDCEPLSRRRRIAPD